MKRTLTFLITFCLTKFVELHAADTELSETLQLPECHSLGWVSANVQSKDTKSWNGVLNEAKWGTPSPQQAVTRNWDWKVSDDHWREEVRFDLWLPDVIGIASSIVVMSGHGENLKRG
jgi:hypothetical protein